MANKLAGGVKAGSTGWSWDFVLRSSITSLEVTGKVASDITATYWRQGGLPTAITCVDLAAIGTAWTSGGVKEAESTRMPGSYRLDVPDAAFASGADWVEINAFSAGSFVFKERFALETHGAAEVHTLATAINAKTTQLTFTTPNVVDAAGAATPSQIAAAVLNTAMTEGYAGDGAQATLAQGIYMLLQHMSERAITGTTMTVRKLDGTSVAMTFTLNSPTNPTSVTRTT